MQPHKRLCREWMGSMGRNASQKKQNVPTCHTTPTVPAGQGQNERCLGWVCWGLRNAFWDQILLPHWRVRGTVYAHSLCCRLRNRDHSVWHLWLLQRNVRESPHRERRREDTSALPSPSLQVSLLVSRSLGDVSRLLICQKQRLQFVKVQYIPSASFFHAALGRSRTRQHFLPRPFSSRLVRWLSFLA